MSNLSRRSIIGAMAAAPIVASVASTAKADPLLAQVGQRTSIFLSPHQDDESIRMAAYICIAADRGDKMVLVQSTDGAATHVKTDLGLSNSQITRWRNREQATAWDWLTDGRGSITYVNEPDGSASWTRIRNKLREVVGSAVGTPEIYVANWHWDRSGAYSDGHPDHIACTRAGRALASEGVIVRFARHPGNSNRTGVRYSPRSKNNLLRMEGAAAAYQVIGSRSTSNIKYIKSADTVVTS